MSQESAALESVERLRAEPRFASRYRLGEPLGEGGMSMVVRATQLATGRTVAVKVLAGQWEPELGERFVREGRLMARLKHPNIVEVFDLGFDGGHPYIVMELAGGGSLRTRLNAGADVPQSLAEVAEVMAPALRALDAMHREGIVHRDLKPDNILFGDDGQVRLADFGLAAIMNADRLTATGVFVGTMLYSAPETIQSGDFSSASDVFSMGVILFELLAGRPPFFARTFAELARKITQDPPPSLAFTRPDLPAELVEMVLACLAKDPAARPVSAGVLAEAVAGWPRLRVRRRPQSQATPAPSDGSGPGDVTVRLPARVAADASRVQGRRATLAALGAIPLLAAAAWFALREARPPVPMDTGAPSRAPAITSGQLAELDQALIQISEESDAMLEQFTRAFEARATFLQTGNDNQVFRDLSKRAKLARDRTIPVLARLQPDRETGRPLADELLPLLVRALSAAHFQWWMTENAARLLEDGPGPATRPTESEGIALEQQFHETILELVARVRRAPDGVLARDGKVLAVVLDEARGMGRAVGFLDWTPPSKAHVRAASAAFVRKLTEPEGQASVLGSCFAGCWKWGMDGSFKKASKTALRAAAYDVDTLAMSVTQGRAELAAMARTMAAEAAP